MSNLFHFSRVRSFGRLTRFWAALLVILTGCSTKPLRDPIVGPGHTVQNVFRKEAHLPATVRRVAILPIHFDPATPGAQAAVERLEPIYHAELTKAARFETVLVKPAQLQQWTGKSRWDDYDELPAEILNVLAKRTGSEGVLFANLTHYKPYTPIRIGWRMRLVANDADILWSIEELFDGAEQTVSNSARRHDRALSRNNPVLEDSRSILLSPTRFGQYTLQAILETLPQR